MITARGALGCASCGEPPVDRAARFCEACGAPLESACASCGGTVAPDGYCTSCGVRAIGPITVADHGQFGYATHLGLRHPRNEDAAALTTTAEGWPALVVADGVSASPNPQRAAAAAVAAAAAELAERPFAGPRSLRSAIAAAHRAVCDVPAVGDPYWPAAVGDPACTIVVAVAGDDAVHAANIGDTRGYLLAGPAASGGRAAVQLTTDDSVAARSVREGVDPTAALDLPGGHAITAWLGADAPAPEAHLATRPAAPGDLVLACSDGLWNYAPAAEALAELVDTVLPSAAQQRSAGTAAATVCEALVGWAIDQGGSDNICVALAACPPNPSPMIMKV